MWEDIFKEKGRVFLKPQEDMSEVIKLMKKEGLEKVLDLGCGTGRHIIMLAKAGFDVYGTDISEEGLKQTKAWLKKEGLTANLKKASCYEKFPFNDDFFDAVISIQVIHHNYIDKVRYSISEIERVLKPNGVAFVTVSAPKWKKKIKADLKIVAPRTYIPTEGGEKDIPHYMYTKKLMKKDFKNFKVLDFHRDSREHYCILGKFRKNH